MIAARVTGGYTHRVLADATRGIQVERVAAGIVLENLVGAPKGLGSDLEAIFISAAATGGRRGEPVDRPFGLGRRQGTRDAKEKSGSD